MSAVLFYMFALIVLISAVKMVFSANLVHSALYMVATFAGVAFIYLLLYADYLAVAQLLVYVGAVSVLVIFGVMLTRRGNILDSNPFNRYKITAGIIAIALFIVIGYSELTFSPAQVDFNTSQTTVGQIAGLLLNDYVVAFEAAGILLLVAIVGAILVGKGADSSK